MVRLKENKLEAEIQAFFKFQFLMVRLKDFDLIREWYVLNEFQFLMVRLKVLLQCYLSYLKPHFNSLWCD